MNVLFDTNVVLDVLLARQPFAATAAALIGHVERGELRGMVGATTITTLHDLARRAVGAAAADAHIARVLSLFEVAPVTRAVLGDALAASWPDFEDAVLHEAARHAGAVGIVTRDQDGFAKATLRVYAPDALLALLTHADDGV